MKKTLLMVAIMSFLISNGQIYFEPGYIVKNNGDKVECLIKNQDWVGNPSQIEYKLSESSAVEKTDFFNINSFHIYNTIHYYKKVSVNFDKYLDQKDFNPKQENLILQVLLEGDVSLYANDNNVFFYQKKDEETKQLLYKKYIENSRQIENHGYRSDLYSNFKCQQKTADFFKKIRYSKSDLIKFFKDENDCMNSAHADFTKNKSKGKFNLNILGGGSFYKGESTVSIFFKNPPSLGDGYREESNTLTSDNKMNFLFGLEAEYQLPFHKNKWSVFIAPNYQQVKYEMSKVVNSGPGHSGLLLLEFDYSYIDFPIGVRHYFNLNKTSQMFIDVSYSKLMFLNTSESRSFDYTGDHILPESDTEYENAKAIKFGIGYKFKNKIGLSLNYTAQNVSSNKFSSTSLVASYNLF